MPPLRQYFPFDRWTVLVLTGSMLLLLIIGALDSITEWTMLLLYLGPLMCVAWLARGFWWVVVAVLTGVLWYNIRSYAPPPDAFVNGVRESVGAAVWNALARIGVLLVVGLLCTRLRALSRSPDSLASSHDNTGMLSAAGLRETLERGFIKEQCGAGPVAILMLDIERKITAFGGQSSEHAALAGAVIGKLLLSHARAADLCVRPSPNHFLVIMFDTSESAAATLNAAVQDALPQIVRSLDDTVTVCSLLLYSRDPVKDLSAMRSHGENRLVILKVMGQGRSFSELWPPKA